MKGFRFTIVLVVSLSAPKNASFSTFSCSKSASVAVVLPSCYNSATNKVGTNVKTTGTIPRTAETFCPGSYTLKICPGFSVGLGLGLALGLSWVQC